MVVVLDVSDVGLWDPVLLIVQFGPINLTEELVLLYLVSAPRPRPKSFVRIPLQKAGQELLDLLGQS